LINALGLFSKRFPLDEYMKNNQNFLDPSRQHTLSEQECELISFFRTLSSIQRQEIFKAVFSIAINKSSKKEGSD
jgi:hypothetical protein